MSVALVRSGFTLSAFGEQARVHSGRGACQLSVPHIVGARELADYLVQCWGEPRRFRGTGLANAQTSLRHFKGVIYFNNCFARVAGGLRRGDHIDLWTGTEYYNEILRLGAGGDAGAGARLFDRADRVWFFPLPD